MMDPKLYDCPINEVLREMVREISGEGSGPKPWRRKSLAEPEQVSCWRCERETGVATSAVVKVVVAPLRTADGKKTGGTEIWACALCLSRGVITELIR